jgi:tripartite-type tricarboxylate transporter receptor subunit TctC
MSRTVSFVIVLLGQLATSLLGVRIADAQSYPDRPIHFVVPYAAGGGVDVVARIVAERMSADLKQPIVVENRVGGGGIVGAEFVARSAPDGYTLLVSTSGHTILPSMSKLPWDPIKDFTPVSKVVSYPVMLVVHPSVPATTLTELIALAKQKPGMLNYGTGGVGTPPHLAMELLKSMVGIDVVHVTYRGNGLATTALLAGEIQMTFDTMIGPLPFVRAGKLRAIAVSSRSRFPTAPDIPTVSESGVPGYEFEGWTGMFAPANTPKPVIDIINAALARAVHRPEIAKRLLDLGYLAVGDPPDQFAQTVRADLDKIAKITRDAGIQIQQ